MAGELQSQATEIQNVVSRVKDYDIIWTPEGGTAEALEYSGFTMPGRAEATSYNLPTNLRNIQESAGDGAYNAFVVQVPVSLAKYKAWHDQYGKTGTIEIKSIVDASLTLTFNVTLSAIGDFTGAMDAINAIDITFQMTRIPCSRRIKLRISTLNMRYIIYRIFFIHNCK